MLRQKRALYARKIIEDGFCVNQNAVKINMEARNNYLFRKKNKKKQGWEADQVPLTAPVKSDSDQLSLEAKTNRHTKSNDKAYSIR